MPAHWVACLGHECPLSDWARCRYLKVQLSLVTKVTADSEVPCQGFVDLCVQVMSLQMVETGYVDSGLTYFHPLNSHLPFWETWKIWSRD